MYEDRSRVPSERYRARPSDSESTPSPERESSAPAPQRPPDDLVRWSSLHLTELERRERWPIG